MALVSLVASDRFNSRHASASAFETDLDSSVCVHALIELGVLIVPDLTADPRTRANPLVVGEPHFRFYAGALCAHLKGMPLAASASSTSTRAKWLDAEASRRLAGAGPPDGAQDLLITAVGLPNGMNGRQVADAARSVRVDLEVLFVTGYAENAVVGNGHLDPSMA